MMSHDEALAVIRRERLVAILRGVPLSRVDGVVSALIGGGVRVLEFTFDHGSENAVEDNQEKIRRVVSACGDRVIVGCGTALTVREVEAAYEAGACLAITPNVNPDVIRRARELGMVAMPGAMTPTEIELAWRSGADIVKLFPAGELGLGYIKAVRGPLGFIPMSAVGGVQPENVSDFLSAGICGFGVGSPLVVPSAVKSGDDSIILERAKAFTNAIAAWEASR
ncbi:MAG: 2-dehydro-3-deoxyphosphogluconate aldolase [Clostridia bacterium]|nr:2-dehydro-3-deoxyphosphogluconate aldolase [Clostridia bacterium]